jgi:hypothetical protein
MINAGSLKSIIFYNIFSSIFQDKCWQPNLLKLYIYRGMTWGRAQLPYHMAAGSKPTCHKLPSTAVPSE